MSEEYKEFFRNEFPFKEDVGKDPLSGGIYVPPGTPHAPAGGIGGIGGIGGGISGGVGVVGDGDGDDSENINADYSIAPEPQEPLIIWRTLLTLTAKISAPNIIKHPKTGKILTYNGKLIKGVEATYTYVIQAGLVDSYVNHLDCVLMEFTVNGKTYNENDRDKALTDFFNAGFMTDNGRSVLGIRTKWQEGHYPPEITTIYFKVIDVNADKESVDNIALIKDFRDTITMKIENRKISFSKS